jgi:hypothetical protein
MPLRELTQCEFWGHRGAPGTVCPDCGHELADFPPDPPPAEIANSSSNPASSPASRRDTIVPLLLGALALGVLQPWEVIARLESRT